MRETDLLSPAGNLESLYQAVQNGADAVYFGGKSFGARAFVVNFTYDEMKQAIDYAHLYGVKVYITVNTLVYENEVPEFLDHAESIYKLGADALIMQDIGMISLLKHRFLDVEIHASTQAHNHSDDSLYFLQRLGAVRAVLAREMDLGQIKSLRCNIEKEVFIHGALCVCYSGQCLMSALTKGRSGNRGECAQSCRMRYRLIRGGEYVRTEGEYLLSPKDLGLFDDIEKLIEAGVGCFKIEGRMKPPEYVGHVTKIYAKLLENYRNDEPLRVDQEDMKKLEKLFNRGFTKGHLFEKRGSGLMSTLRPNHRGVPLGRVVAVGKDRIRISLDAELNQGDGIKFEKSDTGFICNRIYKSGRLIGSAKRGETVELDRKADAEAGESIVKTSDALLMKELQDPGNIRKVAISGKLTARLGEPLRLEISDDDGHSVYVRGGVVQQSRTSPASEKDMRESLEKLGDTPFRFNSLVVDWDDDIFIAKSALNALRREATLKLTEARVQIKTRRLAEYSPPPVKHEVTSGEPRLHVLVRTLEQFEAIKDMPVGDIYTDDKRIYHDNKKECTNLRLKTDRLEAHSEEHMGEKLLVTDHGGIYAYGDDNDCVIDYTVWSLNSYSLSYLTGTGAQRIALSPELDIMQTEEMISAYLAANGQPPAVEAIVYARHELMAMRHCVISGKKDCGLCKTGSYMLEDHKGERFPIVTDGNCNNYILNSRYIEGDVIKLLKLGIKHFRVELFDENAAETTKTVQRFLDMISIKKEA